jgi:hypothetical protein
LRKLVKRKAAGKQIESPAEREQPSNVIDLMAALRNSLKGRKPAAVRAATASRKKSKRRQDGAGRVRACATATTRARRDCEAPSEGRHAGGSRRCFFPAAAARN